MPLSQIRYKFVLAGSLITAVLLSLNACTKKEEVAKAPSPETLEMVADWATYYPPDQEHDESEEFRDPANAFKYKLSRGPTRSHKGYDYACPCGTKVPSKTAGVVTIVGNRSGFGKTVAVRTGGCTHIYAHLSRYNVSLGQKVKPGTLLGLSGNTGRSRGRTGCHLHYETCSKLYAKVTKSPGGSKGKRSKKRGKSKARR